MKCSPNCRIEKLGMIYTILGSFCSFFNREGANIRPQIRLRKIPDIFQEHFHSVKQFESRSGDQDRQNGLQRLSTEDKSCHKQGQSVLINRSNGLFYITALSWSPDCSVHEKENVPLSSSRGYFISLWSSMELLTATENTGNHCL